MEQDFHYYVTYLIAVKAGFSTTDAYKIAYSSQYVDDNTSNITVYDTINKKPIYSNFLTQSYNPLTQNLQTDKMYQAFHFLPGDTPVVSKRCDGQKHILDTTPYSKAARCSIRAALSSQNPYWIGIASHAFVDTWAHQNFIGTNDSFNSVRGLLQSLFPSIGHSDVAGKPDKIGVVWKDSRLLNPMIDNNERFLEAADKLFFEYSYHLNSGHNYQHERHHLTYHLKEIFTRSDYKAINNGEKYALYNALAIQYSGAAIEKYDSRLWLKTALIKSKGYYYWRSNNHTQYDWHHFQEAASNHFEYCFEL